MYITIRLIGREATPFTTRAFL